MVVLPAADAFAQAHAVHAQCCAGYRSLRLNKFAKVAEARKMHGGGAIPIWIQKPSKPMTFIDLTLHSSCLNFKKDLIRNNFHEYQDQIALQQNQFLPGIPHADVLKSAARSRFCHQMGIMPEGKLP